MPLPQRLLRQLRLYLLGLQLQMPDLRDLSNQLPNLWSKPRRRAGLPGELGLL